MSADTVSESSAKAFVSSFQPEIQARMKTLMAEGGSIDSARGVVEAEIKAELDRVVDSLMFSQLF